MSLGDSVSGKSANRTRSFAKAQILIIESKYNSTMLFRIITVSLYVFGGKGIKNNGKNGPCSGKKLS
jgi:hypothetical protein